MYQHRDALAWLTNLEVFGIRPGLERMQWMLERLGHPERRLKFIHIAGTNGKGSTAAMIASILQAADVEVGVFSSPSLYSWHDRIRMQGIPISDEHITACATRLQGLADELCTTEYGSLTEFEATTLIALLYFAEIAYPDLVVWETGLGGTYDSTNVVFPLVSVITNIGFDHMNILGETLSEIAMQKAGIIKPGVAVVVGERKQEALHVLETVAAAKRARLYRLGEEFRVIGSCEEGLAGERFSFVGPFTIFEHVQTALIGSHQIDNAAVALMTIDVLRQYYALQIDEQAVRTGLLQVRWPGRFELIYEQPAVIIDGARNVEAMQVLVGNIMNKFPGKRLNVLFSALADKPVQQMIDLLAPLCKRVIVTHLDHVRAEDSAKLAKSFRDACPDADILHIVNRHEAFVAWKDGWGDDVSLATGSLYLIADLRNGLALPPHSFFDTGGKAGE